MFFPLLSISKNKSDVVRIRFNSRFMKTHVPTNSFSKSASYLLYQEQDLIFMLKRARFSKYEYAKTNSIFHTIYSISIVVIKRIIIFFVRQERRSTTQPPQYLLGSIPGDQEGGLRPYEPPTSSNTLSLL